MDSKHRQHLQRLYLKLLQNVTDYKGIIGGLYAENILTSALKERVEAKNGSDQLREILDILPKRGERAFPVFYQVLVDCGEDTAADLLCPELASQRQCQAPHIPAMSGVKEAVQPPAALPEDDELPKKWPDTTSHQPFQVEVVKVLEGNAHMRALFDKGLAGSGSVYAMHKPTRGIFLLIGNQYFKEARANGEDLQDRDGTEKDTIALTKLFRELHFRVVTKVNLTAEEMLETVQARAEEVEATDNCFVCAVLTHGEKGVVYGVDGKTVALEQLKAALTDHCQMLIGKPKVFLIQACQGSGRDKGGAPVPGSQGDAGTEPPAPSEQDVQQLAENFVGIKLRDTVQSDAASEGRVSSKSDVFVAMATVADFVSWRNTNWGTWFVQAVVYIFSRFACKYEINQLLTRVNKLVSRAETSKGYKQVSVYHSALTSELYFFPGLQQGVVESHSEIDFTNSDVSLRGKAPPQTASLEPQQPAKTTLSTADSGSSLAQPSDGVDGGRSVLVE